MDQENTVETMEVQDDAAQQQEETPALTLDELFTEAESVENPQDDAAKQPDEAPSKGQKGSQSEIDKAIGQRLHAQQEKLQKQFMEQYGKDIELAQMAKKFLGDNPVDRLLQEESKEYAKKNGVNETVAMDLIRYKHGLPIAEQAPTTQPRDENGRFIKTQTVESAQQRVQTLTAQAEAIQKNYDDNIVDILNDNPDMLARVQSGEWDINAAYVDYLRQSSGQRPRVPGIPKGGAQNTMRRSIANMSEAQLAKLEEAAKSGARIRL